MYFFDQEFLFELSMATCPHPLDENNHYSSSNCDIRELLLEYDNEFVS